MSLPSRHLLTSTVYFDPYLIIHTGLNLPKKYGGNQNIGGQEVPVTDEIIGVSQLLGHVPGLPTKSTPMTIQVI